MLDRLRDYGFDIHTRNHSDAILNADFAGELLELIEVLADFSISVAELVGGGGGESPQTQRLRRRFSQLGWQKHEFHVETVVDGEQKESKSHEIDHVKRTRNGTLALEIEWNNKDPFFDRDLENFQRLHAQSIISVGVIVTRGASMQAALLPLITDWMRRNSLHSEDDLDRLGIGERTSKQRKAAARLVTRGMEFPDAFARKFVADKFGQATTHWSKLEDRVRRGVGNPCPLLLVGLPVSILRG